MVCDLKEKQGPLIALIHIKNIVVSVRDVFSLLVHVLIK